jgi:serine/threonine protein kinase
VLLLDWGLAKVRSEEGDEGEESDIDSIDSEHVIDDQSMTGFQKLQGTISYMSPEQIKKDSSINGRTDIYSLGSVLYEALSGRTPASGDTMDKLIASTMNDQPPLLSTITSMPISNTLDDTIMGCLQKNPDQRIPTMAELIRRLKQ